MFEAHLAPTDYDQPKPGNGKYPALVYKTYAEFEYEGHKVLAKMAHQGAMNADGNNGFVTVHGNTVEISFNSTANSISKFEPTAERVASTGKKLIATLKPLEFWQRHPFADGDCDPGYTGMVLGVRAEFGVLDKYEAVIDGNITSSVMAAPCSILPMKGDSTKCIIEFDDATVFMAERYGRDTYDNLVRKTVNELQQFIRATNAGQA